MILENLASKSSHPKTTTDLALNRSFKFIKYASVVLLKFTSSLKYTCLASNPSQETKSDLTILVAPCSITEDNLVNENPSNNLVGMWYLKRLSPGNVGLIIDLSIILPNSPRTLLELVPPDITDLHVSNH